MPKVSRERSAGLRLAPHLSFGGLDRPLFRAFVGSIDPTDHVRWAAAHGFAGVCDPFGALRTVEEQDGLGQAIEGSGLESGSLLYAAPSLVGLGWASHEPDSRNLVRQSVTDGIAMAKRMRSRSVAILATRVESVPVAEQLQAFAENLRDVAPLAEAAQIELAIEPVDKFRLPQMLVNHAGQVCEIIDAVGSEAVKLIFDTAHIQAMDGDVMAVLEFAWDKIGVMQFADYPGRVEPGAGEIDFEALVSRLAERRYAGLCELEHFWSSEETTVQQSYLERLSDWGRITIGGEPHNDKDPAPKP